MTDQAWLRAAHAYRGMNEEARRAYWQQLSPDQQQALTAAIESLRVPASTSAPGPTPVTGRGCSSPLAKGCLWMILGSAITIGAEVLLLMQGVQMLRDAIGGVSGGQVFPEASAPVVGDCNDLAYVRTHESECAREHQIRQDDDKLHGTKLEPD